VAAPPPEPAAAVTAPPFRVFLLSPADCSGKRARLLQGMDADHVLARRLRGEGAALGEVFSFVSSLYFRGKLTYARAFARPPRGRAGIHVITPCDGLMAPEAVIRVRDIERFGRVDVDPGEARYSRPLLRDLRALSPGWIDAEVVLLGSVASAKYADLLAPVLGPRLVFPADFVGRGDMSRGGLLLRAVRAGAELDYVPVAGAVRHGPRPPRLAPVR
jgi:hypothetical protein